MFAWWCLKPLSTIFQLYRGGQFYWRRKLGGSGENQRPVASHWQTLSHIVVHFALIEIQTHNISGDRHWGSSKSNYHNHMITTKMAPIFCKDRGTISIWDIPLRIANQTAFLYFRFPIGRHCHGGEGRILRCWYQGFFRVFWEMAFFVCLGILYRQKSNFGKITLYSYSIKGIQAVIIEFVFIVKVANIRCFILIAVEIFHNIIHK